MRPASDDAGRGAGSVAAAAGPDQAVGAGLLALDEGGAQRRALDAEFRRDRSRELAEAERQAGSLLQELLKAEQRRSLQTLTAPIDGVVQQLAMHTVGGVVQPAQQLLVIAPFDDPREAEAFLLNRDIGFVRPADPVEVKLETFTFTRFGLVAGEVTSVSGAPSRMRGAASSTPPACGSCATPC